MSVYAKLQQARVMLQSMQLNKSGHNKFAGYQYFELGDFLPQTQEIFNKLGLCGVVSYANDVSSLTIVDIEDGSQVVITSPMAEANLKGCHPIQNLGAVETYQRRYLWVTAMEIVEHDALDASEPIKPSKITPTAGALDGMSDDERKFVTEVADKIKSMFASDEPIAKIYGELEERHLDNQEKVAIWSFLDSKQRAAIKKHGEVIKQSESKESQA